ncbi:MAG: tetratricopeptide repeat protein [Proteobacteria bacterium]|nr:tetratricopeptide repeat protein [Pseudomonadota bacterium]
MPNVADLTALTQAGRLDEAVALGEALLERGSNDFALRTLVGRAEFQRGNMPKALEHFGQAAEIHPESAEAQNNLGIALASAGLNTDAASRFVKATELDPASAAAFNNLGFVLNALGRDEEALNALDTALRLDPNYADAHNNRGITLFNMGRPDEAVVAYGRSLAINPSASKTYNNLGNALAELRKIDAAVDAFERALSLDPRFAEAASNCGRTLRNAGRGAEAIAFLERAIALKPDLAEAHGTLAVTLADLRRPVEAIAAFTRALELDAANDSMRAQRLHQQARICDWPSIAAEADRIPSLGLNGVAVPPFALFALEDKPELQKLRAEAFTRAYIRGSAKNPPTKPAARPKKIRVGYFSSEFHNHATMYLLARVLELHDRERFEVCAYSFGRKEDDAMRRRVTSAVDVFRDVRSLNDQAIADVARDDLIDIAIDLKGYTEGNRAGIFAHRAAPIQISFLGFPCTMGAPFIDYLITDDVIIPASDRSNYSEQLIYLPHSYQANDDTREISALAPRREDMGLPDRSFVFCSFNNTYKITPCEFDIWMSLLSKVDGSVLWLLASNPWAEGNLRREAQARGVDPSRLVFALPAPLPEHLARCRLADLFLDTFNCNAHTTASDALWAGLPLLTKIGQGFAARVAASLLTAIDLPELIARTPQDYAARALELATQAHKLETIRAKLAANLRSTPLFNSALFTRHLEAAYEGAFARYIAGERPETFTVATQRSPD